MFWQESIETMERSELERLQLARLKNIVDYCYNRVPFYKKRLSRILIPLVIWNAVYCVHYHKDVATYFAESINQGCAYHLWFLYLILGIYLLTPFLKQIVDHCTRSQLWWLLALICFAGTLRPLFNLATPFYLYLFPPMMEGYIGYFLFGYLLGTAPSAGKKEPLFALFLILDAMAKLFAPILAFTCDEIWQSIPHRSGDDARNVLLNQMPADFAAYALNDEAMAKWETVMKLRQDVNGILEKARADKRIGKALEAHVSLTTENAELKAACEGLNLAEICIVSACEWADAEEGAEVGNGVNYPELTIGVSEAKGAKCPRCWMHSEKAGADDLCPRCAAVVSKLDIEI